MMGSFAGVFVVMVTPFDAQGRIDFDGIGRCVEWWVSSGVHGILPLGSTGEFASLTEQERRDVAEAVVQAVKGRIPVIIGASAETTSKAVEYARHAKSIGADGVMVLPSYFYVSRQEEIVAHFRAIAEEASLPIMVYNNPRSAKADILPETVAELAAIPEIRYIKESTNDIKRITELRTCTDDRITIFCGCEHMAYESFVMGAKGWVCVVGNIAPRMAVALYDSVVVAGDLVKGWELYKKMLPTLRYFERAGKGAQTLKYILGKKGLCEPHCRLPRAPLTATDKAAIDSLVKGLE
jgi:4-hydroxy-tetrahydrodipicolinate synthase